MWPAIIAAAGTIGGALINHFSKKSSDDQNQSSQNAVNAQNERIQKEFAQNSIQWRVQDAKNAGIHPLAALGANVGSATPSAVAFQSDPDYSFGKAVSETGQNVSNYLLQQQIMKNQAEIANINADTRSKEIQSLATFNNPGTIPGAVGSAPNTSLLRVSEDSSRNFNGNGIIGDYGGYEAFRVDDNTVKIFPSEKQMQIYESLPWYKRYYNDIGDFLGGAKHSDLALNMTKALHESGRLPKDKVLVHRSGYNYDIVNKPVPNVSKSKSKFKEPDEYIYPY